MDGFYVTYWANIDPTWDYKTRTLYYELVNRANAMGDRVMFGRQLKRGQLVISLRELERETGIPKTTIGKIVSKFETFGSLKVELIKTSIKGAPKLQLLTLLKRDNIRDNIRDIKWDIYTNK